MSVREVLATHDSRELSEWRAFEYVNGFTESWTQEALSDIHEQLQLIAHVLGAQHIEDEDPETNPIPPPKRYPRRAERRSKFGFEEDENEG